MCASPKIIGLRIKKAREDLGLTLEELATKLGFHKSTIQRYESGKVEKIKLPVIENMANILLVNPDWIVGKSDNPAQTSNFVYDNIKPIETKKFRMLGEIACGEPIFCNEEFETFIEASASINADFCLTAKGDSMVNARIYDGDVVFIKAKDIVDNGKIAAVIIDNSATLKRVYYYRESNKLVLAAENSAYEPLIYINEELDNVRIIGEAVAFQSLIK